MNRIFCLKVSLVVVIGLVYFIGYSQAIRCYKCKGDDECDFKTRTIYIDNCTWATKCWVSLLKLNK
jgi:hypothetical protein